LQPLWPVLKWLHVRSSRVLGHLYRPLSRLLGHRGVPVRATERSLVTAAADPGRVTLHPGRPEEPWVRPVTPGEPAGHWLFEGVHAATTTTPTGSAVTLPATFTLEVADGMLVGDYAATIVPGKVLDHETSTYFGVTNWRDHPIFLRPTVGRVEQVSGTVLSLTTRGTAVNYYHFLYDSIGRLAVLEESMAGARYDAVVVPHAARYQRELLALAGIEAPMIQPRRGHAVRADRLLVPSNPNWTLQAPPATVAWLRDRLRPSTPRPDGPRRVYITRGTKANTRRYVEEPHVRPELERRGFVMVDPGTLRVQEQIDLFAGAEVVVAPHGAGLSNITFASPGVRVLEMFAPSYVHLGLWAICQAVGADYHYLVAGNDPRRPRGPGVNTGVLDDVSIEPARMLAAVDELLDRPAS